MARVLRTLTVLLLVALVPVRAVADTALGACPSGHEDEALASHAHHGHSGSAPSQHEGDHSAAKTVAPHDHCSTAAFAPSATPPARVQPVARGRVEFAARALLAFFPERLDRPPLA